MKNNKNFDMIGFLNFYSIPYNEHSNQATDAYYALDCFECGKEDGLGVPKDGSLYGTCWKCGYKNGYKIVQGLTGESNIKEIIKKFSTGYVSNHILVNYDNEPNIKRPTKVVVPGKTDWHPKLEAWRYLEEVRKFNPLEIIPKYDLRYNTHGADIHSYRITFPFYYDGKIVAYQSRTYRDSDVRFIASKNEESLMDIKHLIYGIDDCNSDKILLVEGLFDKIRMGVQNIGAITGTSTTIEQSNLVRSRFKRVYLLFDQGEEEAQMKAEKFAYQIGSGRTEVEILDLGMKGDPDILFAGEKGQEDLLKLKAELKLY